MESMCTCPDSGLIVKQRQEIILLTNELKNQEDQINILLKANSNLKNKLKINEKEKTDFENVKRTLNKEISILKESLTKTQEEQQTQKQKLNKKDQLIQTQSTKYQQISLDLEKLKQQLNEQLRLNKDQKSEISKQKLAIRDLMNKFAELKTKNEELIGIVENKNELIKLSSNQIVLLENNLQNLMNWVNSNKVSGGSCNANKSASSGEHLTPKLHSPVSQSSAEYSSTSEEVKNKQRLIQIQSANEPPQSTTNHRVYESSNEMALSSLLQSLKETWLESNLKYEELKNLIVNKFNQPVGEEHKEELRPCSSLTNKSTLNSPNRSSTPANF